MPIIIDCQQGTEAWFRARLGIPTASEFGTILAPKAGSESKTRRTYLYKLAGEIVTGEPSEKFSTPAMERGHALEPEARDLYAFMTDSEPELVGFMVDADPPTRGCSPDSLIGDAGMLEIKTKAPHLLIDVLKRDQFPSEHVAQCQGALWVAEREWIDIAVYYPKMPLFVKRAYRDEEYISRLSDAVAQFNEELADTVSFLRSYGEAKC